MQSRWVNSRWDGRTHTAIRDKQTVQGWGDSLVEWLFSDLKRSFPGTTGFSAMSLWRMRQMHETYTSPTFLSQLVRDTAPHIKAAKPKRASRVLRGKKDAYTCEIRTKGERRGNSWPLNHPDRTA